MMTRITWCLSIVVLLTAVACNRGGGSSEGGAVSVGSPVSGTFGTGLQTDAEGKPYIDYTLTVSSAGSYRIDLVSSDTDTYDPYVSLLQGTNVLGSDDDGGDAALQSRLTQELQPGTYTVRVTRYGSGQIDSSVPFTLTVAQAG
jgi:hypothetical protein